MSLIHSINKSKKYAIQSFIIQVWQHKFSLQFIFDHERRLRKDPVRRDVPDDPDIDLGSQICETNQREQAIIKI